MPGPATQDTLASMASTMFPERAGSRILRPDPIELVVRRAPLASIQEVLSVSIHDVVNHAWCRRAVCDLYRISRRIEDESWLRRQLADQAAEAWIRAHI